MKHEELEDLSKDDHKQYLYANPTTDTRNYILPAQANVVGLTFRGALGHKADLIRFMSFRGEDLGCIKADGSIKTSKVEVDEAISKTLNTQRLSSSFISSNTLEADEVRTSRINGINLQEVKEKIDGHSGTGEVHFTQQEIDHKNIQNSGGYTHQQIDQHISNAKTHFKEEDINHSNIKGCGSHTHKEIDKHLDNQKTHFTVESINHSSIHGHGNDDHTQYVHVDGKRGIKKLDVDKDMSVGASLKVGGHAHIASELVSNRVSASEAKLEALEVETAKVSLELITDILTNEHFVGNQITCSEQYIGGDLEVAGTVNGIKLEEFVDTFYKHIKNEERELIHPVFTATKKGYVPTPAGIVSDNRYLTASGKWKSFGEYLELTCSSNEFLLEDVVETEGFGWKYDSSSVTVPLAGVYEFFTNNIESASLNGDFIPKSKLSNYLLKLERKDKITFELPKYLGSVYVKRIDDTGEL